MGEWGCYGKKDISFEGRSPLFRARRIYVLPSKVPSFLAKSAIGIEIGAIFLSLYNGDTKVVGVSLDFFNIKTFDKCEITISFERVSREENSDVFFNFFKNHEKTSLTRGRV